jgi:hypothetical protein
MFQVSKEQLKNLRPYNQFGSDVFEMLDESDIGELVYCEINKRDVRVGYIDEEQLIVVSSEDFVKAKITAHWFENPYEVWMYLK